MGATSKDVVNAAGQLEIFVCQPAYIVGPDTHVQMRVAGQHFWVVVLRLSQLGDVVEPRHRRLKAGECPAFAQARRGVLRV